ncbi:hypothetical protein SAMN05216567_12092 [Variovorax sp. OK605]|uniref:hypothetical protein n=1 Tax=unclassified Variovorax TaxID=663243 RepID=UPI0008C492EC|nr:MULTISPECIES: hypothetical protein [unclassified Variovorax]SEK15292.1 hypothetical protein SAMN05518853_11740 [Variovorax sp. OK202]SFE12328.1 hypothetical protein SAMN05444746_11740 [Variovorax sp. OK212]SFQ57713.1 hypothetical protein SAMN05216567_12092 [Variovorax sp. OK605]
MSESHIDAALAPAASRGATEGKSRKTRKPGLGAPVPRAFRYVETHGPLRMFAEGVVFVGARVISANPASGAAQRIEWQSAFYPGPRHRNSADAAGGAQMLPLGFHEGFDLYLQRRPGAGGDAVVARSGAGDANTLDTAVPCAPGAAQALREGTRRAGLLAAGPYL